MQTPSYIKAKAPEGAHAEWWRSVAGLFFCERAACRFYLGESYSDAPCSLFKPYAAICALDVSPERAEYN